MMKKFVLALIISLCLVLPFSVNASELEKSFETSFDLPDFYNDIYSMTSYDDSGNIDGYIIYSKDRKIYRKYDLNNKNIWDKSNITVKDLDVTINSNNNLLTKRINPDTKEVIWQKEYGGSGKEYFDTFRYGYFYSYNNSGEINGYLIIFSTSSLDLEVDPGYYIIKYDLTGNMKWIKKHIGYDGWYVQGDDGDWFRYYNEGPTHRMYPLMLYDITKDTSMKAPIVSEGEFSAFSIEKNSMIIYWKEYNTEIKRLTMLSPSQGKLVEKEVDNSFELYSGIAGKTVSGKKDEIYLLTNSGLIKMDYDFNELSSIKLPYTGSKIYESYDGDGEFNGYIVTGYDRVNKKGYITKFTYPKKVIESKNSDVEVISDTYPGKTVTVKAKEKTGYVVKRIVVKDSSGKEIEVGSDGTFIMPDDDVSVEVVYEKKAENIITNPDTVSAIGAVLFLIMTIVSGTLMVKNNRKV